MGAAPTGDVTLVFTDMEGSSARWEADFQGTRRLLSVHDAVIRASIREHGGYEVKAVGDGFMIAFGAPAAAADFCLSALRAVAELGLPVRMGVHRGAPLCLADPRTGRMDYFGPVPNKAARLEDAASSGQIVVSDEARAAHPGPWIDLGEHVLRGLEGRHRLWQLGEGQHPRLRTVELRNTNLPARPDSFIGRDEELATLRDLLGRGERLVTLLGPGGAGKTRLSQRVAAELLGERFESAWFCDLSEARTLDGVVGAVATALELPLGKDAAKATGWAIAGRGRTLVVLDNFEQAVEHAAATVGQWAQMAPDAVFLATSRIPLRLRGERTVEIASLTEADGVQLLVDRGHAVDPEDPDARALVARLDGLALAIELAAARTRSMSVREVLARLDRRFRLLAGGPADLPHRHRALKATLDWSWDLMTADERQALTQLSVFEGGFTLDAAEDVLRVSGWAPDVVQGLVEHSLVHRDRATDRYHMLVSVTEYAAERARELGGRAEAERRHGLHYARAFREEVLRGLDATGDLARRRAFTLEIDNLVSATRRATLRGDGEVALATLVAAAEILEQSGPYNLGADLAATLRAAPGLSAGQRLVASNLQWNFYRLGGRWELPVSDLEERCDEAQALGAPREEAIGRWNLGQVYSAVGEEDRALVALEQALAVARAARDRRLEGRVLNTLAVREWQGGRFESALALYQEALAANHEAGSRRYEGAALGNMGLVFQEQGDPEEALGCFERALQIHQEIGNRRSVGITLGNLGVLHREQGRWDRAMDCLQRALDVHTEIGNRPFVAMTLGSLGDLAATLGRDEEAMGRYQEALDLHRAADNRPYVAGTLGNLSEVLLRAGRLEEAEVHLESALAISRSVRNPALEGVVLTSLGRLRRLQGRPDAAVALCEEALVLLESTGDGRYQASTRTELAASLVARGELDEARRHADQALAMRRRGGDPQELGLALLIGAEVAWRSGRHVEARDALAEAERLIRPDWPSGRELARLRALVAEASQAPAAYVH